MQRAINDYNSIISQKLFPNYSTLLLFIAYTKFFKGIIYAWLYILSFPDIWIQALIKHCVRVILTMSIVFFSFTYKKVNDHTTPFQIFQLLASDSNKRTSQANYNKDFIGVLTSTQKTEANRIHYPFLGKESDWETIVKFS